MNFILPKRSTVIGYIVLFIVALTTSITGTKIGNKIKGQTELLQELIDRYRHKSGYISDFKGKPLSYTLFSNNGGRNWYVIKEQYSYNDKGEITGGTVDPARTILGPVEKVHPGLIEHLDYTDYWVGKAIFIQEESQGERND